MKFKILHDGKKRIRVHAIQHRMTLQQADLLELYIMEIEGVSAVKVNESTGNAIITYNSSRQVIIDALKKFSYEQNSHLLKLTEHSTRSINRYYKGKLISMVAEKIAVNLFLPFKIRKIYITFKVLPYIFKGLKTLMQGKLKVEVLDGLALGASLARADFGTASSVSFLLSLGELLEEWTHKRSVSDLARTMSLGVDRAWLKRGNEEIQVPVDSLEAGDLIVMRMGNTIPIDAVVHSGEGMINQASMTGESMPVSKRTGMTVYAGTIVEEGNLVLEVIERQGESRYDKIVHLIEESEQLKSDVESRASVLADRLVPYTIAGSAVTYLLTRNVIKAMSVLMVDFSCALKLFMPLSVLSAMSEAGKEHITVKGGKFLEIMSNADTIVFDKTGTLTHAKPKVAEVTAFADNDPDEMLRIAACLEEHFPHSVATAVVTAAQEKNLQHEEMHTDIEYIVAHGISSMVDNKKVVIGSYHFVFEDEQCQIDDKDQDKFDSLSAMYSHLYLAIEQKLVAVISIFDPIRDEAKEVISMLKSMGISKIAMLTGDNYHTANNIADTLGIDHFEAEVMPEDKAKFIEQEKSAKRTVVMIGDGINDSPALSSADVGIAMNDGASIAKEISDITIAGNSLYELVTLKILSDRLMKRINGIYKFVIGFNGALIALGLAGLLMPAASALLHNMSTVGSSLYSMTRLIPPKEK